MPLILLEGSPGLFAWWSQVQESKRGLGSQMSQCHICHNILAKASHKVTPDSIGREIDSTSLQEGLWSHVKGMDRRSKGLWVFLESVATGSFSGKWEEASYPTDSSPTPYLFLQGSSTRSFWASCVCLSPHSFSSPPSLSLFFFPSLFCVLSLFSAVLPL